MGTLIMSEGENTSKKRLLGCVRSGDYKQAVELKEQVLQDYPADEDVVVALAFALSVPGIERASEGIGLLLDAVDRQGESADLLIGLAHCYAFGGEDQSAYLVIKKAIELGTHRPEVYALLAVTITGGFGVQADIQEAIEADRKAVELDPDNWEYRRCLGADLWKTGDLTGASHSLEKALERIPGAEAEQKSLLERWLGALKQGKSYADANTIA